MSREMIRIGLYWFPPEALYRVMQQTWEGQFNAYLPCKLVQRHCGDCPVWQPHMTLLDAITILKEDRPAFIRAMSRVLAQYLPLTLFHPQIRQEGEGWGDNVFIRWEEDAEWKQARKLRKALMAEAGKFAVVEQVSWESVNDIERTVDAFSGRVAPKFRAGLEKLAAAIPQQPLRLIHAPNISLDWYVRRLGDNKKLRERKLPFPPDPHISIATAVREDHDDGLSAADVGRIIKTELPEVPAWREVLGADNPHRLEYAYIVEPAPHTRSPLEVTVIDRITAQPRRERRQNWVKAEKLPSGSTNI